MSSPNLLSNLRVDKEQDITGLPMCMEEGKFLLTLLPLYTQTKLAVPSFWSSAMHTLKGQYNFKQNYGIL